MLLLLYVLSVVMFSSICVLVGTSIRMNMGLPTQTPLGNPIEITAALLYTSSWLIFVLVAYKKRNFYYYFLPSAVLLWAFTLGTFLLH